MESIKKFLDLSERYPLVFGVEAKSEKEMKQLQRILEELYKFTGWEPEKGNPNTLAEFRSAYRDFEVLVVMSSGELRKHIKPEYVEKVMSNLESTSEKAYNAFMEVMKKHQKLNAYFKDNFTMKKSDFKKEIRTFTYHFND